MNILNCEVFLIFLIPTIIAVRTQRNYAEKSPECGISCDKSPCQSPFAWCANDTVCGKVCISNGHVCNEPEEIENGGIKGTNRLYGAKITYYCEDDYELIGSTDRTCVGDKEWSGKSPYCVRKGLRCDKPPDVVENGYADIADGKEEFYVGDSVAYKCHIGFFPIISINNVTSCNLNSDGSLSWTPKINLKCQEKKCDSPDNITNGLYSGNPPYNVGTRILYVCNNGYTLQGPSTRTCTDNQQWSETTPVCAAPVSYPSNIRIILASENSAKITWTPPPNFDEKNDRYILYLNATNGPKHPVPFNLPRDVNEYEITGLHKNDEYVFWMVTTRNGKETQITKPVHYIHVVNGEKCKLVEEDDAQYFIGKYRKWNLLFEHHSEVLMKCKPGSEISIDQSPHEITTEAKTVCNDGVWKPEFTCKPARCFCRDRGLYNWLTQRNFVKDPCKGFIQHKDNVLLSCPLEYPYINKQGIIKCYRGRWVLPSGDLRCKPYPCSLTNFLNADDLGVDVKFNKKIISPIEITGYSTKANGEIYIEEFIQEDGVPHNSEISLTCRSSGYELYIDDRVQESYYTFLCNNGTFSEFSWQCRPGRCSCPILKNKLASKDLQLNENCRYKIYSGKKIQLKCKDGYHDKTKEYFDATCDNTEWKIDENKCEEPSAIATQTSDVTPNSVLYTFTEISFTTECDPFFTDCLQILPGNTASNKCEFKKNANVRAIMDGQEINDESIEVPDQSILKLRCNKIIEFFFEGDNILKCDKTKWNGTIPTCTRLVLRKRDSIPIINYDIKNGKDNVDDDGSLNVTEGATLKLHCLYFQIYLRHNIKWISADITELNNAAWNSKQNVYELILSPISRIHESKYSCCVDQHLCNSIRIRVTGFQCEDPPRPTNGFIRRGLSKSLGSEIEYGCDINYVPVGEQISKCIFEYGQLNWSHPPPQCKERTCDHLFPPQNGYIRKIGDRKVDTVVSFACNPGYELSGKENTTCLWIKDRLQWSDPTPECIKTTGKKCKKLSVSYEKEIKYDTEPERKWYNVWTYNYEHGTTATVICKERYEIFPLHPTITSAANTICIDGQWKPDILNCVEARCACRELSKQMIERKRKFRYCNDFVESKKYHMTECQEGYTAKTNYAASCIKGEWILYSHEMEYNKCHEMKTTTDCQLDLTGDSGLLAIHEDTPHAGNVIDFTDGSLIKFICKTFSYKLEGAKNATCIKGQWTEEKPKCVSTSSDDYRLPPYLKFLFDYTNENHIVADDGRIILPKHRPLTVECFTPYMKTLTLVEHNITQKETPLLIAISRAENVLEIQPVKEKASATVKCVNSYGSSTTFNLVVADTCEVDVHELRRRGLRVVPNSKQRTYVEGDKIQLECSSNNHRTTQHIMICKSGREWDYGTHMSC